MNKPCVIGIKTNKKKTDENQTTQAVKFNSIRNEQRGEALQTKRYNRK